MSEELIIKHCSPTLAGLKTANIFSCEYRSEEQLREEICRLNQKLVKKGIRVLPLKKDGKRALIYAYRPTRLRRDLCRDDAKEILEILGYGDESDMKCIKRLAGKMRGGEDFPHEIGLFLGYPPEDVAGFISNGAKNYKCNGCWKVYGDEVSAKRLFARYKKCTDVYTRHYACGRSIERLTVSE